MTVAPSSRSRSSAKCASTSASASSTPSSPATPAWPKPPVSASPSSTTTSTAAVPPPTNCSPRNSSPVWTRPLIHIPQIPLLRPHQRDVHVVRRGFRRQAALLLRDVNQRLVHVFGHVVRVATDVEIGAVLQPRPKLLGLFEHAMLHVDLVGLVAGERQVEPVELALALITQQFVAIEEIRPPMLLAEEQ